LRCIHDKIRPPTFLFVGHLFGKQGAKFILGHARSLEGTGTLHFCRRRCHNDRVDTAVGPRFKQQRDIENRDRCACPFGVVEKPPFFALNQWMNDPFQATQCLRIVKHASCEFVAIDAISIANSGEFRFDQRRRWAGV